MSELFRRQLADDGHVDEAHTHYAQSPQGDRKCKGDQSSG
jgi:hypothetical protein